MAGKGGKRVGAGRKSNAQKMVAAEFLCDFFGPKEQAIQWKSLLASSDERIRLDASKYLCDRMYGKAHQAVDLKHSGEVVTTINVNL